MSLGTHNEERSGASGGAAAGGTAKADGPRFVPATGSYASWRTRMDVFLDRHGADGIHKEAMTADTWRLWAEDVKQWGRESVTGAMARLAAGRTAGTSGGSAGSAPGATAALSDEVKADRKVVVAYVERSVRIH